MPFGYLHELLHFPHAMDFCDIYQRAPSSKQQENLGNFVGANIASSGAEIRRNQMTLCNLTINSLPGVWE